MSQHLAAAERQELQALLQARRDSLLARREAHLDGRTRAEQARELLLQDGDDANQRDADREVDLAMTDRDVVAVAAIDAALQRLAQGDYGSCKDCGDEIPLARLRLAPTAQRCIACETRFERSQPRTASM
jgi:DnaK suppressor protein